MTVRACLFRVVSGSYDSGQADFRLEASFGSSEDLVTHRVCRGQKAKGSSAACASDTGSLVQPQGLVLGVRLTRSRYFSCPGSQDTIKTHDSTHFLPMVNALCF